jgi:hypothetical protein
MHRGIGRKTAVFVGTILGWCASDSFAFAEEAERAAATAVSKDGARDEAGKSDVGSIETTKADGSVGEEAQTKARELFRDGNALVRESLFVQAVSKYEEALTLWDHPGIHYNLALALLNLDQPLRMRAHLIATVAAGEQRVGEDKFRRAEEYLKLVEKQLATLTVEVQEAGADVKFDGSKLFAPPGKSTIVIEPGRHTISVKKAGFEPRDLLIELVPGEKRDTLVKLYRPEEYVRYERRWDPVFPWTTTLAGVGVAVAGGVLYGLGGTQVSDYDARAAEQCGVTGCDAGAIPGSPEDGRTLQGVGLAGLFVGGAVALTGGILIYLNRPMPTRVDPETGKILALTPRVDPTMTGMTLRGSF